MPSPTLTIAVVGISGSGKSTSIENLDPLTTGIINIERKVLPFKNPSRFVNQIVCNSSQQVYGAITQFAKNASIKIIIVDSLTALSRLKLRECREMYKGYDIFSNHNNGIARILSDLKDIPDKIVIVFAIDELLDVEQPDGSKVTRRVMSVQGKELMGKVEEDFLIVLYTDLVKRATQGFDYHFITNTDGVCTAKSPKGMFTNQRIANDLKVVIDTANKYYEPAP